MQKVYTDSYMMTWTKRALIEHIRCLESSIESLTDMNNNQYKMLDILLAKSDMSTNEIMERMNKNEES